MTAVDELRQWVAEAVAADRQAAVHGLLADLSRDLHRAHASCRDEVSGFLTWLEGHMGAKVDELSNKTKLRAYHEHDYETIHGVLKANRRKLAVDPLARAFTEHLRAEYDRSVAKLHPLLARIEATDRLIDQIVYQLYGLTDEEIALVEGESSPAAPREANGT